MLLPQSSLLLLLLLISVTAGLVWDTNDKNPSKWHLKDRPRLSHHDVLRCLENKTVVLVGDSVTRYQYVDLVFWLSSGYFYDRMPQITWEKDWKSWKSYFVGTNARLGCLEVCDCYRIGTPGSWTGQADLRENRHFFHPHANFTVRFYEWLGDHVAQNVAPVPTAYSILAQCRDYDSAESCTLATFAEQVKNLSRFSDISSFLATVVAPEQPDHLVINGGHWPHNSVHSATFADTVHRAAKRSVWKTTTATRESPSLMDESVIAAFGLLNMDVFDAHAVTRGLSGNKVAFVDALHFQPFVYHALNEELVFQLCGNTA